MNISICDVSAKSSSSLPKGKAYKQYLDFFEEVYKKVDENYYQPINRDAFDKFVEKFNTKIYSQLEDKRKTDDVVRWRSASLLIKSLKTSEDVFSEFYPPKPAQEYKQTALGVRHDLGIDGELVENGFKVTFLEPRCDAYEQGVRVSDVIFQIGTLDLRGVTLEKIKDLLSPLENSKTTLKFLAGNEKLERSIDALSKEFFKQTVFVKQISIPGILFLEIKHFNQKTAEDLFRYLNYFKEKTKLEGLIIDLRGNPGGPPLAARELTSFFLKGGEEFAYFQKKGQPKSMLDVPTIPAQYRYDGPMVILIDKKSGSSSELFSGVLQRKRRAVLMGTNSAGQVMLKSMFNFDDKSMILLITARGHFPDGGVFSFDGLTPDKYLIDVPEADVVMWAAKYFMFENKKNVGL